MPPRVCTGKDQVSGVLCTRPSMVLRRLAGEALRGTLLPPEQMTVPGLAP